MDILAKIVSVCHAIPSVGHVSIRNAHRVTLVTCSTIRVVLALKGTFPTPSPSDASCVLLAVNHVPNLQTSASHALMAMCYFQQPRGVS